MGVRVMAISLLQVSAHVIAEKGTILSDSALILQVYLASASATATATATVAPTMGLLPLGFWDIFVSFAYFTSTNRYYIVFIVRHIPMVYW